MRLYSFFFQAGMLISPPLLLLFPFDFFITCMPYLNVTSQANTTFPRSMKGGTLKVPAENINEQVDFVFELPRDRAMTVSKQVDFIHVNFPFSRGYDQRSR